MSDDPFVQLFSESPSRVLLAVRQDHCDELAALCYRSDVPFRGLGETGGTSLIVRDALEIPVAELRTAYEGTLPAALG